MNPSIDELLKYGLDNGIINLGTILQEKEMNERKKYLEAYESKKWVSNDGRYCVKLPDSSKKNGTKIIRRKNENDLDDAIIRHMKQLECEPTWNEVFDEWLNQKLYKGDIKKQSFDRYLIDWNNCFRDTQIAQKKVRYLTENELEDFVITLIKENKFSAKAWSNLRTLIKGSLKYARKRHYTSFDVIKFLNYLDISNRMFKKTKRESEDNVFTEEEMHKIIDKLNEKETLNNLGVLFAVYTGMRVGEVIALKWADIKNDIIHVQRMAVTYKNNDGSYVHEIEEGTKTDAGTRDVVITPQLKEVIKRIRKLNPFTEYLFEKGNGKLPIKNTLTRRLYSICDSLHIQRRGMHTLRKTFITSMINAGVEESIILEQVGHTNISTSKKHYYYNNKKIDYVANQVSKATNY